MDVITSYLELCLRLGRHIDGLVDAYYGPPEISEQVEAEELREPRPWCVTLPPCSKRSTGTPSVRPVAAGCAPSSSGSRPSHAGSRARRSPTRTRSSAVTAFDRSGWTRMPSRGSPRPRRGTPRLGSGRGALPGLARGRRPSRGGAGPGVPGAPRRFPFANGGLFGLPKGEAVEVEYVTDEPWAAFNYYQGGLLSRVAVNTDVAMSPTFLVEFAAHEAYPGHHTENTWKEQLLVRDAGCLEELAQMIGAPAALISEGIAGLAPEMMLGDDEQEVTAEHMRGTSVAYDPELSRAVQEARRPLGAPAATSRCSSHPERRDRGGRRVPHALGAHLPQARRAGRPLHHRPGLALVRDNVHGRLRPLQPFRGRRSGKVQAAADRAAHSAGPR